MNPQQEKKLDDLIGLVTRQVGVMGELVATLKAPVRLPEGAGVGELERAMTAREVQARGDGLNVEELVTTIYEAVKHRILTDPQLVAEVVARVPAIRLKVEKQEETFDGDSLSGRVARLMLAKFFDEPATGSAVWKEMQARGWTHDSRSVYRALDDFTSKGYFRKTPAGYHLIGGTLRNVAVEEEA